MDGTLKLHSGAMVTPYDDTGDMGCTAMNLQETVDLLKALNKEGFDFHVHTVGEASSRLILDAVEEVRKELGTISVSGLSAPICRYRTTQI